MKDKILQGDAAEVLKTLPAASVDMIMTSPPYYGLRDYGTAEWVGGNVNCNHKIPDNELDPKYPQGTSHVIRFNRDNCHKCGAIRKDNQLGLEATYEEYISKLCDIFDEARRVLKNEGTCWVNLGDSYSTSHETGTTDEITGWKSPGNERNPLQKKHGRASGGDIENKSLMLIPFRFAIEMVSRGWILRNTIIWHKKNCMPSSASDRFTVDFEYLFFFSKQKKYYFKQQLEPHTSKDSRDGQRKEKEKYKGLIKGHPDVGQQQYHSKFVSYGIGGRNKRAVWNIATSPYTEAHFAVYPEELCETPIKAGCPEAGVVLDPFFGSGTTGLVARKQGKHYIGVELNPEYIKIAEKRLVGWKQQKPLTKYVFEVVNNG